MSKKKKSSPRRERRQHNASTPRQEELTLFWRLIKWPGLVITFLSSVAGLLTYLPIISIEVGSQLDDRNALSHSYIVSNDWIFPIYRVETACLYDNVTFDNGTTIDKAADVAGEKAKLEAHQKSTIPCYHILGTPTPSPLKRGTIGISVSYYPYGWFYKKTTLRLFRATRTVDNKTIWLPQ